MGMVIETGKIPTPAVLDAGVNEEAASNGDSHFPVNERNGDVTPRMDFAKTSYVGF
jgi:hypothetical protein